MNTGEIRPMKVSNLAFDLKNPRLIEFGLTANSTEAEVMKVLWEAMDVRELIMSIAASGFFRHEPVIVAQEDGKNIVIEGNRRPCRSQSPSGSHACQNPGGGYSHHHRRS